MWSVKSEGLAQGKTGKSEGNNAKSQASDVQNGQGCDTHTQKKKKIATEITMLPGGQV